MRIQWGYSEDTGDTAGIQSGGVVGEEEVGGGAGG